MFKGTNKRTAFDISDGIVMEENVDNTILGMPYFTLTDVLPQNEVMPKIDEKLKMGVLYSGVLTFDEEKIAEKNITYDIISTTSDTAFLRTVSSFHNALTQSI